MNSRNEYYDHVNLPTEKRIGITRAREVQKGTEVTVLGSGRIKGRFDATVVEFKPTSQDNNPALIVQLPNNKRRSISGATWVQPLPPRT